MMTALELTNPPTGTVAQRAIWWALQIDKWLLNGGHLASIPDEAAVVILPSDDPELCSHNLTLSRSFEGPQVIIKIDRTHDSSIVVPSLYTPVQDAYAHSS